MRTAKAWNLTPQEWRQQPVDDQALMTAFELFESTREAYATAWREDNKKEGGNHADREFRAMQREQALKRRGLR